MCGGTKQTYPVPQSLEGLSPRVRGNRAGYTRAAMAKGSIPACAGEPGYHPAGRVMGEVYPRVCGGTTHRQSDDAAGLGLSPRVRGNPGPKTHLDAWGRSIPACAGEPPCRIR